MRLKTLLKRVGSFFWKNKTDIVLVVLITVSAVVAVVTSAKVNHSKPVKTDVSSKTSKTNSAVQISTTGISCSSSSKKTTGKRAGATKTSRKTTTETTTAGTAAADFPIDINTVTYEQLLQINGVGDATARRILDYRSQVGVIRNMSWLLDIDGIGDKTYSILNEYLYVSEADYEEIVKTDDTEYSETAVPETTTRNSDDDSRKMSTTVVTESPQMREVNINVADAWEISECLLISEGLANEIIALRNKIHYFSNALELLYVDGMSEKMLSARMKYIVL